MCPPIPVAALAPTESITCTGTHAITQADLDAGIVLRHRPRHQHRSRRARRPRHHPSRPVRGAGADQDRRPEPRELRHRRPGRHLHADRHQHRQRHLAQRDRLRHARPGPGSRACPPIPVTALAPTESITCTGTHAITQADLDAGTFFDTGHATSTEADAPDAPDTIQAAQSAVLALTKTDDLNPANYDTVGQVVTYTLTATNTGNVTLHNVTVSDTPNLDRVLMPARRSRSPRCAPADSIACTGTHAITQADLDAGTFIDTGHATSTEADAPDAPDTIQAAQSAVLALTKTDDLNPANYDTVGQIVTYTLTATNTGNITLHNVTISDTPNLDGFSCLPAIPVAALAPGDSVVCTGTHAITQADLDAGTFTDTGHATSTETDAPDAPDTIQAAANAVLTLTKTDDLVGNYDTVGQIVTYTLTATNTGNITLHNVTISDTPDLDGFSCVPAIPVAALAPTESVACTGTHAITQADLDAGSFLDTGHATSTETDAPDVTDIIQGAQNAVLALTKTDDLNPATYDTVGQVVTYTLTATNTGNITLHDVTISDTPALDGFSCMPADPGRRIGADRIHRVHRHPHDHPSRPRRRHVHRHRPRHQHRNRRARRARHHPSRSGRGLDVDQDRRPAGNL